MKQKVIAAKLFVFMFYLFFTVSLLAQQQPAKSEKAAGNISRLDLEKNFMVIVTKEGKLVLLDFSPKTKVTKSPGAERAEIKDIKAGDAATVTYRTDGAKRVAMSVEFYRPGGCPEGQPCEDDQEKRKEIKTPPKSETKQKSPQ